MSSPQKIRVVIVDDHNMLRQGLAVYIHDFDDLELDVFWHVTVKI